MIAVQRQKWRTNVSLKKKSDAYNKPQHPQTTPAVNCGKCAVTRLFYANSCSQDEEVWVLFLIGRQIFLPIPLRITFGLTVKIFCVKVLI